MAMNPSRTKTHACDDPKMIPVLRVWACDRTCDPHNHSVGDDGKYKRQHPYIVSVEKCDTCGFVRSTPPGVERIMELSHPFGSTDICLVVSKDGQ